MQHVVYGELRNSLLASGGGDRVCDGAKSSVVCRGCVTGKTRLG